MGYHIDEMWMFEELTDYQEVSEMVDFGITGMITTEEGAFYFIDNEDIL